MSVNDVLDAVRIMSPEERAQVRDLLETLGTEANESQKRARQRLFEEGLLTDLNPGGASPSPTPTTRQSPAQINGKPLSETVIEERG